jgi:predicted TIM-barrel fold metal-dependent hydrolase
MNVRASFSMAVALMVALFAPGMGAATAAEPLPIFDAHLHYSHDAWELLSPSEIIALLKKGGIRRAMVSSSNDDGTQKLYAEAPELIIPELRPYRNRSETGTWFRDPTMTAHLEDRLRRYKYVAIGEFHLYGADADLPVPRRMVELAKQYKLFLHAHSDVDAIERLFRQDPDARILWAHSGFESPARVRDMLRKHKNLYADLAFRSEHGSGGKVDAEWRAAFMEFPDRFLVGTDTFVPERWHYVVEHANWSRAWLQDLPASVANRIAFENGERIFGSLLKR